MIEMEPIGMRFIVLTIFPDMFAPFRESIIKRAQESGVIDIKVVNFRDYALSKHKNVDDVPYGGGSGMVLKPEPVFRAYKALENSQGNRRTILLSPQGKVFRQETAYEMAGYDELILICGHYEGFDERIRILADEEISIGDYVLTGGELAAMVVIDAVARNIPGVLGKAVSAEQDSYTRGTLEYPQYTRPPEYEGMRVPDVLLSGNHALIDKWRRKQSLYRTFLRRADLFKEVEFLPGDYALLEELVLEQPEIASFRENWQHLKPLVKRKSRQQ